MTKLAPNQATPERMMRLLVCLLLLGTATRASAQIDVMAQAIGVVTHSDPIPGGGTLTEARLVQPLVSVMAATLRHQLQFNATLDLEGLTMPGGELAPGDWGEGFVDRRHPHTTVHELNLSATDLLRDIDGKGELGVVVGKGFVPFGTDDPMSRPFERYPVNHHLAQLLERAIVSVQYRWDRVLVEGALFNGDEPTRPSDWPVLWSDGRRFGDSRSGRVTLAPVQGLELEGSLAHVHSPESRPGAAPDADKSSVAARWQRKVGAWQTYAMMEYARSSELSGVFVFHSTLAEASMQRGRVLVSYRYERTERPEELRLVDLFRTQRPSPDNSILATSRWTLHTVHLAVDAISPAHRIEARPFVELTMGHVAKVGGGLFDPVQFYGTDSVHELTFGLAIGWNGRGHRMGTYGEHAGFGENGMEGMRM